MNNITTQHLAFMNEAASVFAKETRRETHIDRDISMIALRMGMDRDCIMIYNLEGYVANFVNQIDPTPTLRKEVDWFAREMEKQLKRNDHRLGWANRKYHYLLGEMGRNILKLNSSIAHSEFQRRCVNIANYAMMLADNDKREQHRETEDAH